MMDEGRYTSFYEPIIKATLNNIIQHPTSEKSNNQATSETTSKKHPLIVQYRGKCTEDYARALHRCSAPCMIIMTLRKLKTTMPSLKPPVEKMLRSGVVYKITCPRCNACYVGQTSRHLQTRFREHLNNSGPVKNHLLKCNTKIAEDDIEILTSTSRGENYLLTLEALVIRELMPGINTKDEYRSRTLTIKI